MSTLADYRTRIFKSVLWAYTKPSRTIFTVSGVTVTPTAGAVYSDKANNFTVISASISEGSGTITATGTAAPNSASATLEKVSGTGDVSIAYSAVNPINQVTLALPAGTVKALVRSTGACTVKKAAADTASVIPLTTWPQPVFSNPASGGDLFMWEPTPSATPGLVFDFTDDQTLEVVAYVNTRIAPSTTISTTYVVAT